MHAFARQNILILHFATMLHIDLLDNLNLKIKTEDNIRFVWDIVRKRWIRLTPEEHVRQALVHYLVEYMHYPPGLIALEKQIKYGTLVKRYDIVVYDRNHHPWMLAECKAPDIAIDNRTLHQLLQYHSQLPCPYWLLSNGQHSHCANAANVNDIYWMEQLPEY